MINRKRLLLVGIPSALFALLCMGSYSCLLAPSYGSVTEQGKCLYAWMGSSSASATSITLTLENRCSNPVRIPDTNSNYTLFAPSGTIFNNGDIVEYARFRPGPPVWLAAHDRLSYDLDLRHFFTPPSTAFGLHSVPLIYDNSEDVYSWKEKPESWCTRRLGRVTVFVSGGEIKSVVLP